MNKVRNKMINKEAKSYLAKLLATENLTVEHRKVETAYFDLGKSTSCSSYLERNEQRHSRYASCT